MAKLQREKEANSRRPQTASGVGNAPEAALSGSLKVPLSARAASTSDMPIRHEVLNRPSSAHISGSHQQNKHPKSAEMRQDVARQYGLSTRQQVLPVPPPQTPPPPAPGSAHDFTPVQVSPPPAPRVPYQRSRAGPAGKGTAPGCSCARPTLPDLFMALPIVTSLLVSWPHRR